MLFYHSKLQIFCDSTLQISLVKPHFVIGRYNQNKQKKNILKILQFTFLKTKTWWLNINWCHIEGCRWAAKFFLTAFRLKRFFFFWFFHNLFTFWGKLTFLLSSCLSKALRCLHWSQVTAGPYFNSEFVHLIINVCVIFNVAIFQNIMFFFMVFFFCKFFFWKTIFWFYFSLCQIKPREFWEKCCLRYVLSFFIAAQKTFSQKNNFLFFFFRKKQIFKKKLHKPLAFTSDEGSYNIAVLTGWWFTMRFNILLTFFTNCWSVSFTVR